MTQDRPGSGRPTPERRRLLISLAAAAVAITIGATAIAVSLGALGNPTATPRPPTVGERGWTPLPDPPLSPRQGATAVTLGRLIVIVGGDDGPPCPPNADCAAPAHPLADGAVWDAATRTWRSIAPAPVPIGLAQVAVAGATAYFWVRPRGQPDRASSPTTPTRMPGTCCPFRRSTRMRGSGSSQRRTRSSPTRRRTSSAIASIRSSTSARGRGARCPTTPWRRRSTGRSWLPARGSS